MRSIFIDSGILLDIILERYPYYEWALGILLLVDQNQKTYSACTSVHSLLNAHYLTKKYSGEKSARNSIRLLVNKLDIITEDRKIVENALASGFSDFEDAVQYHTAISVKADVIITRNIKDYKQSTIPVLTAEQFLRSL